MSTRTKALHMIQKMRQKRANRLRLHPSPDPAIAACWLCKHWKRIEGVDTALSHCKVIRLSTYSHFACAAFEKMQQAQEDEPS